MGSYEFGVSVAFLEFRRVSVIQPPTRSRQRRKRWSVGAVRVRVESGRMAHINDTWCAITNDLIYLVVNHTPYRACSCGVTVVVGCETTEIASHLCCIELKRFPTLYLISHTATNAETLLCILQDILRQK